MVPVTRELCITNSRMSKTAKRRAPDALRKRCIICEEKLTAAQAGSQPLAHAESAG
jgi:hypothetical protein